MEETAIADRSVTTEIERLLAEVLAEVLEVAEVSPTSDFFDDLGADSLLMAHFCARLNKRPDLPSASIKDVYKNSTIRNLAAAVAAPEPDGSLKSFPSPSSTAGPTPSVGVGTPVGRTRLLLCGTAQLLSILGYGYALVLILANGYAWIADGSGVTSLYVRSALFGGAFFVGFAIFPIAAKWALVGRWQAGEIDIWSFDYFRFWLVKFITQTNPLILFAGSPIYVVYLRALGARIGRGVVIQSRRLPVCADLLSVGENTVIRKDAFFNCYRAERGVIEKGPVTIGRNAFVGVAAILEIRTTMDDGAQLGHASSLHPGQHVPDSEHRVGSPAREHTNVDYCSVAPSERSTLRRGAYSAAQVLLLFGVSLPLSIILLAVVVYLPFTPDAVLAGGSVPFGDWAFYSAAVGSSLVLFVGFTLLGLVSALTIPRMLNPAIKPDTVYPMYGLRYWAQGVITRASNAKFFTTLFGDTSYVVHYLYGLGYDVTFEEQTGANFGMTVKHDSPFHVSVGPGTMAADGLSLINADYSSSSFRVSRVVIAAHSYFGNFIAYPSQAKTSENCLHATKVLVPLEGETRENVGVLGSPSFEIPRAVLRDREFDDLKNGVEFERRLAAKNRHNVISMGLFLLSRWVTYFGLVLGAWIAVALHAQFGVTVVAFIFLPVLLLGGIFLSLVERASTGFRDLTPLYCSMYSLESFRVERYWKLNWQPPVVLNGTPMKIFFWRLLGVRIGGGVFDDGCMMMDKTMITIGDGCALNAGSVIQPHSQEDGTFKSDRISIGDRCTIGTAALVHYGVTMGEYASLGASSFLMKGTDVPPRTQWGENPARELEGDYSHRTVPAAETLSQPPRPHQPKPIISSTRSNAWPIAAWPASTSPIAFQRKARQMTTEARAARDYWREVLLSGGFRKIPRWALAPGEGVDTFDMPIADELATTIRNVAKALEVSLSSVFLAAHAKTLAVLTGEKDAAMGYVALEGAGPLPCRLAIGGGDWRTLVIAANHAESELLAHMDYPVENLKQELNLNGPAFETVFEPFIAGDFDADTVLRVGIFLCDGSLVLRLAYRTEILEADYARRIAGYHVTALERIVADPEAEHDEQSLLSDAELEYQLHAFDGPNTELPDRRFHELFEQRVRDHPDAVAAMCGDQQLTYAELNVRANRLGRALCARGLRREGVVAVVTERNLDWMTAVLAIFKAGGVYLPIEPHFPAERIAKMLSRADCRIVATEAGSTRTLYEALESLPRVRGFFIETAYSEDHSESDLGIAVEPSQLAYIYFTSGSTGEPKGAMCEHEGMVNHILAKIDDLEVKEGEAVAQVGPQCFDISLWQLVAALLVGGRTVIVEQDTILDPQRFVETITDGGVAVIQVVPSYLEVLLSYMEQHHCEFPKLHSVSVTGEALTFELAKRWFTTQPDIKLVNAYGLTETSDDTNHEVMDRAAEDGRIPLGPPVQNVHVRVVDENLDPVPLGAPGEIIFSGVCVGRGYINDPERTRLAFMTDPLRGDQRLYRSGDFGRWRTDGKLEFLGRRDAQVKIRGFRIEIGDIENAMLGCGGVGQAAVIVTERADGSNQLVGFFSGQQLDTSVIRGQLGAALPEYMVPTNLYWQENLPLNDNGKIHRKSLASLAGELDVPPQDFEPPATLAEQNLATAWAEVLGVPEDQVGRQDNFFDRGTSLTAVELVIALDGAVSLKDFTRSPVLADLALLIDGIPTRPNGLLQLLSEAEAATTGALICFPYAGGNAINFRAMESALRGSGLAVYAVELPGHDLGGNEPFAVLDDIVQQVVDEISDGGLSNVMLWGHSAGAAFAIETARRLPARAVDVQRVFVAAQLLGDPASRRAHMEQVARQSNAEIAATLSASGGYTELASLDAKHAEHVGAAYRHDCESAHRSVIESLDVPPSDKLAAPVSVVLAADDPAAHDLRDRYAEWRALADTVELCELRDGGHYFLRTRPADAAEVVRAAIKRLDAQQFANQ